MADWLSGGVPRRAASVLAAMVIALIASSGIVGLLATPAGAATLLKGPNPACQTPSTLQGSDDQPVLTHGTASSGLLTVSWSGPTSTQITPKTFCVEVIIGTSQQWFAFTDGTTSPQKIGVGSAIIEPGSSVQMRAVTADSNVPPWSSPFQVKVSPTGASSTSSTITTTTPKSTTTTTTATGGHGGGGGSSGLTWVGIGAGLLVIVGLILLLRRRSSERSMARRNLDRGATMTETDDMFLRSSDNFRGNGAGEAAGDGGHLSEVPVAAVIDDATAPVAPSESSAAAPPPTQAPVQAPVPVTAFAPQGVDVAFMSAESSPDLGRIGAFRVHPQIGDDGVIWAVAQGSVLGAGLWSEKRVELGEDAEPSFVCENDGTRLFVGVYDGMGGSGGAIARQTRRGPVTQAYDASRITRAVAERWFSGLPDGALDAAGAAGSLHDDLTGELADRATTLAGVTSGLVGTLKRTLPSTIATVVAEADETATRLTALWAGDSRCYVLAPSRGLQQISRDDTAIQDALEALLADPPLDNVVCADRNFTIHHAATVVSEPVVVVVASDGCFGYVPSPPLFEHQILAALMSAGSAGEWMQSLLNVLGHQAQDDTSLAIAAIGFPDFAAVKETFSGRFHELEVSVGQPYRECSSSPDRQAFEQFRTSTWEVYKPGYEARIPETAVVP
jgi:hypothetical protein